MVLKDNCGRPLLNLRVAVTRKCNLRCSYCHGEGEQKSEYSNGEMTADEITRVIRIAATLGVKGMKLTGGEPLMRGDIVKIVKKVAATRGLTDLSMTTNGTLLSHLARDLRKAGLKRVNISLPTLDREIFFKLTGGEVQDAVSGVKAAIAAGFHPVKLNMLLLRDINNSSVSEMVEFAKETGTILQLIELEPINMNDTFYLANHVSLDRYDEMLKEKALKVETRRFMQNRQVYHLPDVVVEVVRPIENTEFCLHCSRLRITSDGKLKPCLMRNDNLTDILTPLRNGASDEQLAELFKQANQNREPFNKN
jgi:cyclic pyranopterin phosphate synthase